MNEKSTCYWNYWTGWILSHRITFGKGYEVHGIVRRASTFNTDRLDHFIKTLWLMIPIYIFITAI